MDKRSKRLCELLDKKIQQAISYKDFLDACQGLLPSREEWVAIQTTLDYKPFWVEYQVTATEARRQKLIEECREAGVRVLLPQPQPRRKEDWLRLIARDSGVPLHIIQVFKGELNFATARREAKARREGLVTARRKTEAMLTEMQQRRMEVLEESRTGGNALDAFESDRERRGVVETRYEGKHKNRRARAAVEAAKGRRFG